MELIPFDLYQNHGGEIRCISRPPSARNVGEAEKGFQIGSVVGVVNWSSVHLYSHAVHYISLQNPCGLRLNN